MSAYQTTLKSANASPPAPFSPINNIYCPNASVFLLQLSASGSNMNMLALVNNRSKTWPKKRKMTMDSHCNQAVLPVPL